MDTLNFDIFYFSRTKQNRETHIKNVIRVGQRQYLKVSQKFTPKLKDISKLCFTIVRNQIDCLYERKAKTESVCYAFRLNAIGINSNESGLCNVSSLKCLSRKEIEKKKLEEIFG